MIPKYSYSFEIESSNIAKSFAVIKDRLIQHGATLIVEELDQLKFDISASSLAKAVIFFPNTLEVNLKRRSNQKIQVEVIRKSEKIVGIGILVFATLICLASFVQNHQIKALLFPFIFYAFFWLNSFLPIHPAHKKLRNLMRFSDD